MTRVPCLPIDSYFEFFSKNLPVDSNLLDELDSIDVHILKEAIQVCSPNLYQTILNFQNGKPPHNKENFFNSVHKYFIRSCSRCTPFGLFSGVSFGKYSNSTSLKIDDKNKQVYLRPDMLWLMSLIKDIENNHSEKLKFRLNEAAVVNHGRVFLLTSTVKNKDKDIYESSIRYTKVFEMIKQIADDFVSFEYILCEIKKNSGNCNKDLILNYIKNLVKNEYLISSLRPPLTIQNPFSYFIKEFEKVKTNGELLDKLLKIHDNINLYNSNICINSENLYQELIDDMKKISNSNSNSYLQIDTKFIFQENNLNKNIENELNEFLNILMKINSNNIELDYWSDYKNKFLDNYGEFRLIPLIELLDDTYGIGVPDFYKESNSKNGKLATYLFEKYCYALKIGARKIEIIDEDIKRLFPDDYLSHIPESLELNFYVLKEKDSYIFELGEISGSTFAGKSFGRFSYMMDNPESFFNDINNSFKANYTDEYVTCEIALIPHDERSANVICNRHSSDYEIALSTSNSKSRDKQIRLDDILVGIENNNFYLKSKNLNKKILITMNNMFNPYLCPDVIKFLLDTASQGKILWYILPWKDLFHNHTYIPEIKYKNFIFQSERWKINSELLNIGKKHSFENFLIEFNKYRNNYSIPSYVYIQENSDNRLLVNLDNLRCLKILYNILYAKNSNIWLCNCNKDLIGSVKGQRGKYCSEIFLPMLKIKDCDKKSQKRLVKIIDENIPSLSDIRFKKPFDSWLYFNLYTPDRNTMKLIIILYDFLEALKNDKKIKSWFFIRYRDPKEHIRLRINADKENLIEIFPVLNNYLNDLVNNFFIKKFTLDFYDREIERYGGINCIDFAEKVFAADSYVCSEILKLESKEKNIFDDETVAIYNIMSYLENFNIENSEKLKFLQRSVDFTSYKEEFKNNKQKLINKGIEVYNRSFKEVKDKILFDIYQKRENSIKIYLEKIISTHNDETIKFQVLDSLVHMSLNRHFGPNLEFEYKMRSMVYHILYVLNGMEKYHALKR